MQLRTLYSNVRNWSLALTPVRICSTITMTNSIEAKIKEQGDVVRKLKSENASKEIIQEEVAKLKALKLELGPVEQKPKGNDKPKPVC